MRLTLSQINSATKYPSIETFHKLGERGMLTEELNFKVPPKSDLILTEKIDGTNTRIVFFLNGDKVDYFIGSREELVYAKGDRIFRDNNIAWLSSKLTERSVDTMKWHFDATAISFVTVYGELYGNKITKGSKNYTSDNSLGFRLFDVGIITVSQEDEISHMTESEISSWRNKFGPEWVEYENLDGFAMDLYVDRVPEIENDFITRDLNGISTDDMYKMMSKFCTSRATLDSNALSKPEGIVLRNNDRSFIAKARFEDYESTFKRRNN